MTRLQIPRPLARDGDLTLPDDHLPGQCRRGCHPGWTDAAFGREQAANTTATNQARPPANPELTNPAQRAGDPSGGSPEWLICALLAIPGVR